MLSLATLGLLKANIPAHKSDLTERYTVTVAKASVSCVIMPMYRKKILSTFLLISHVILGPRRAFLHLAWTLS